MPAYRRRTYRKSYGRFRRGLRRTAFRRRRLLPRRRFAIRRKRSANWYARKYNFKEKFLASQFHITNSSPVEQGFNLQAIQIPGWNNRHVNFDQYKIYKWKIVIAPPKVMENLSDTQTTGLKGMEMMRHYLGYDYTDATPPSTMASMMGPSVISTQWNRPLKMIIRPRISKTAYEGVGFTGYMPGTAWIDCDDDGVPHYGFKYYLDNSSWTLQGGEPELNAQVWYTVYYGFKNINRPGNT